jgi:hypothetical protein
LRAYIVQKFTYCIFGSAVGCFGAAGVAGAAVPGSVVVAGLAVDYSDLLLHLAVVVLQLYLFSEQQELSGCSIYINPILDILNVLAVVFTETVMSILLSTTFEAGMEENFKVKSFKVIILHQVFSCRKSYSIAENF